MHLPIGYVCLNISCNVLKDRHVSPLSPLPNFGLLVGHTQFKRIAAQAFLLLDNDESSLIAFRFGLVVKGIIVFAILAYICSTVPSLKYVVRCDLLPSCIALDRRANVSSS